MNLRQRLERLQQQVSSDLAPSEVIRVYLVAGGKVIEMTPEQWRQYERDHPGQYITIRDVDDDTLDLPVTTL